MKLKKQRTKITPFSIVVFIALTIYMVSVVTVLVWATMTSLRSHQAMKTSPLAIFSGLSFKNYAEVQEAMQITVSTSTDRLTYNLIGMIENSLLYAGIGGFVQMFATVTVAYCTAKYKCLASSIIRNIVIVTLIIPIVGSTPSMIDFMTKLRFYDKFYGVMIMRISFTNSYYLVFYAAFSKLSWEYAESAFIDGASHVRVYFSIMLPLVKTLMATVFIIFFIYGWNDYQTPYMLLPSRPTASLGLFHFFQNHNVGNIPKKMAGGVLVFLPVFIIFILFRNKIMGDLTEGGIKG